MWTALGTETVPGRLAQASGVHYDEFSNLTSMIPVLPADGATIKLDAATATRWCDGLLVDDAQVGQHRVLPRGEPLLRRLKVSIQNLPLAHAIVVEKPIREGSA